MNAVPSTAPGRGEAARAAVRRTVTEMAERNALDAGNGDVLDAWLDRLQPQWLAEHGRVEAGAVAALERAAGECEAVAVLARERAEAVKAERDHTKRLLALHEERLFAETEPAAADGRHRTRPSLDALEGLTSEPWWQIASKLLLLAAAGGDLASFYITLAAMLSWSQGVMVWILTVAVTAAAVGLMHVAGRTARNLREGVGGLGRPTLGLMVAGWFTLGAAAFYIRTQVTPPGAVTADVTFGADPGTVASGDDPLLSALLLGALFLGSGILAYWIGFSDHHPRIAAYRTLRDRLAAQRRAVAQAEKAAVEAERRHEATLADVERCRERAAAAQAAVAAEIAELKELARVHLAGLLGDPAATNHLTTGRGTAGPSSPGTVAPAPRLGVVPQQFPGNGRAAAGH